MTFPSAPVATDSCSEIFTVPVIGEPPVDEMLKALQTEGKLANSSQSWIVTIKWHDVEVEIPVIITDVEGALGEIRLVGRYDMSSTLRQPSYQCESPHLDDRALVYGEYRLYAIGAKWHLLVTYHELFSI